jgi:hypothetical protein
MWTTILVGFLSLLGLAVAAVNFSVGTAPFPMNWLLLGMGILIGLLPMVIRVLAIRNEAALRAELAPMKTAANLYFSSTCT